jgi:hypothetical protein
MPAAPKEPVKPAHPRADGRKTLLVYLKDGLIKDLERAASDDDRNVYEIVEEAASDWLARRSSSPAKEEFPAAPGAKRTRKRGSRA